MTEPNKFNAQDDDGQDYKKLKCVCGAQLGREYPNYYEITGKRMPVVRCYGSVLLTCTSKRNSPDGCNRLYSLDKK